MTRSTTAVLTFSPRTVGPWGDENLWRLDGTTAQLVEGGSGTYWHVCTASGGHGSARGISSVPIEAADTEFLARSVVMLATSLFGSSNEIGLLEELHNLVQNDNVLTIAPFWDLSDHDAQQFADGVGARIKIAATALDEHSAVTHAVCELLTEWGLTTALFATPSVVV